MGNMDLWLSTYASLTVTRIFNLLGLSLNKEQTIAAVKDKNSIYYHLAQIPFKNIYNNIILTQILDYRVYLQKIFADYLISGSAVADPEAPGSSIRENLEQKRLQAMEMGERIDQAENAHRLLIAESQKELIKLAQRTKTEEESVLVGEIREVTAVYSELSSQENDYFRELRKEIREQIGEVSETMGFLESGGIKVSPSEQLNFDSTIGSYFEPKIGA